MVPTTTAADAFDRSPTGLPLQRSNHPRGPLNDDPSGPPCSSAPLRATLLDWVLQHELFSIVPTPRFQHHGHFGTRLGALASVVALGITCFYAAIATRRATTGEQVTLQLRQVSAADSANGGSSAASFAPAFDDRWSMLPFSLSMPFIDDPSYFTVLVESRAAQIGEKTNKTVLTMNRTTVPRGVGGKNSYVRLDYAVRNPTAGELSPPDSGSLRPPGREGSGFLQGNCRTGRCEYVRVKVYPCVNGTTAVAATPSLSGIGGSVSSTALTAATPFAGASNGLPTNVTAASTTVSTTTNPPLAVPLQCAPVDEINSIVDNNYLVLTLYTKTTSGDGNSATTTFTESSTELSLKDALSFRQRFPFETRRVVKWPNYLSSFSVELQTLLQPVAPVFAIDRLPRLRTGSDAEYCKLDFELSGTAIIEERHYSTSMDVLGEVWSFRGGITGLFGLFLLRWAKRQFYRTYPNWQGFDENFMSGKQRRRLRQLDVASKTQARPMESKLASDDGAGMELELGWMCPPTTGGMEGVSANTTSCNEGRSGLNDEAVATTSGCDVVREDRPKRAGDRLADPFTDLDVDVEDARRPMRRGAAGGSESLAAI